MIFFFFLTAAMTGEIRTTASLDYESGSRITFNIIATDNGTPPIPSTLPYTLTILDANDNPPMFSMNPYMVTIPENLMANAFVTIVTATDIDTGSNSQVTYSFVGDNGGFRINPVSGDVTVLDSSRLDAEGRSSIVFVQVAARDGGSPSLSSQTLVSKKKKVTSLL